MSSYLSSLAEKAQNAFNESPLAAQVQQLQSKVQQHSSGPSAGTQQPTANDPAAQGDTGVAGKSPLMGNLTHQLRNFQMQYSTVTPVQRMITTEKGVALDFDSVSRDSKNLSRQMYTWGQQGEADIKDVSDRLAYLNFVHGTIAANLAKSLDSSRASFKALRDAENSLAPKRNIRAGIQSQISRIEHENQRGMDKRLAELRQQMQKAEAEDETAERELEILTRKALAESEQRKWAALREYGEKLVLLAEGSTSLVAALPSVPPTKAEPYKGAESTAATRASLQYALDNYKPNSLSHAFQPSSADLSRADSRSFGVTHAGEMAAMPHGSPSQGHSNLPVTPPVHPPSSWSGAHPPSMSQSSPSVNPANLNNSPAPIPTLASATSPKADSPTSAAVLHPTSQDAQSVTGILPGAGQPTVAETGMPLSAGEAGPGPSSGSLLDLKPGAGSGPKPTVSFSSSSAAPVGGGINATAGTGHAAQFESADDEKKRLQREERERLLGANVPTTGSGGATYPSADEEKKRLEREERERLLREGPSGGGENPNAGDTDDGAPKPPPYQDF